MKVTTVPSPVDSLLAPRTASGPERAGGGGTSFPDTLREARFEKERTEARAPVEEETRPADETEAPAEGEGTEEAPRADEGEGEVVASDEGDADGASVTLPEEGIAAPLVANATTAAAPEATSSTTPTGSSATPNPGAGTAGAPGAESGPSTVSTTGAKTAAGGAATAGPEGTAGARTVLNERRDAAGRVAPAGPTVVEGETTAITARGATSPTVSPTETPTAPLAEREAVKAPLTGEPRSGWFQSGEASDAAPDRATFHLLDDGAEAAPNARPASPVAPAVKTPAGPEARTNTATPGAEAPVPAPTAAPAARAEATLGATAATPEVVVGDGDPATLARRIHRLVRRSVARGETELHLRLDPPRLGRVDVDLAIEDDRLGIRFVVESEEVRDTLRQHLSDLHRSLGEVGWSADAVDIDLREEGASGDEGRTSGQGAPGASSETPEEGDASSEIRLWHLGSSVDLRG